MAAVVQSEQVDFFLGTLPIEARRDAERRLDYLREMPRMYAITTDDRYPGCRTFWVDPCYRVFYMLAAGGDDVYVVAITREEVDATSDLTEM